MIKKGCLLIVLSLFASPAFCSDLTDNNFDGKWCGKWDNIYSLCITLKDIKNNPIAHYAWQEKINGAFHTNNKRITRLDQHTLKLENIWFTIDKQNFNQAKVIGMFSSQTRKAELTKQTIND